MPKYWIWQRCLKYSMPSYRVAEYSYCNIYNMLRVAEMFILPFKF